jgi:hypothetical protein
LLLLLLFVGPPVALPLVPLAYVTIVPLLLFGYIQWNDHGDVDVGIPCGVVVVVCCCADCCCDDGWPM